MSSSSPAPDIPAELGAKNFRRLILITTAVYFLVLAFVSIKEYWTIVRMLEHRDGTPYQGMHEKAVFAYYVTWCIVSLLALVTALHKRTVWISFYICLVIALETMSYIFFLATHLHLYQPPIRALTGRFDPHPFVIAIPHPGVLAGTGLSNDGNHRRTTINEGKVAHPTFIYVFGGSTTYDIGNTDVNTWPTQLSRLLGPGFDVENLAVPAFSSVESMMQSLFAFRDLPPACAIYYEGWNDVRNSHVKDLAVDYSNFEYRNLYDSLPLTRPPGILETYSTTVALFLSAFDPAPPPMASGQLSDQKDLRLSKIYRDNIRLIAAIGATFGVRVIFIPQVLDYGRMASSTTEGGEPFIRARDMKKLMGLMNQDMAEAAGESQAYFLGAPLSESWTDADFFDTGHFNPAGARKFALSISESVRKICQ